MTIDLGGDVIIGIDNNTVRKIDDIQSFLITKNLGDKVNLVILRDGKIQQFPVVLEALKQNESNIQIPPRDLQTHPQPPPLVPNNPSPLLPDSQYDSPIDNMYNQCVKNIGKDICDSIFGK